MTTRRDRAKQAATIDKLTKSEFVEKTGFSDHQWHSWFGKGQDQHSPSADQMHRMFQVFDWSPLYIFFGIGPEKLSDLTQLIDQSELNEQQFKVVHQARDMVASNRETMLKIDQLVRTGTERQKDMYRAITELLALAKQD